MSNSTESTEAAARRQRVLGAAQRMEQTAAAHNDEANGLDADAAGLLVAARISAEKIMADAGVKADEVREQAQGKRDEASYWWNLAARERKEAGLPQAEPPTVRPSTPDRETVNEDGGKVTTVTMQRYCNGCGTHLGDVTQAEVDAAVAGQPMPDTRRECPNCMPTAATAGQGES